MQSDGAPERSCCKYLWGNTLARGSSAVDDEPLRHPSSELLLQQNGDGGGGGQFQEGERGIVGVRYGAKAGQCAMEKPGSSQAGASGGHVLRMTRHP